MEDSQSSNSARFFCHQCNQEIQGNLLDFKCPQCLNGFIEELEEAMPSPPQSDVDEPLFLGMFGGPYERQDGQARRRRHMASQQPRVTRRRTSSDRGLNQQITPIEAIIQEFVSNLTGGMNFDNLEEGGQGAPMFLFGNPGDYAWGLGGLDTVITQLLNQMDGMGPPPMPKDRIKNLPSVEITEKHVSESLQCAVCWDDYALGESVRQLGCEHLFHNDCIVPWLELHGTCPVCRKSFVDSTTDGASTEGEGQPGTSASSSSSDPGSSREGSSDTSRGRRQSGGGFLQSLFGTLSGLASGRGSEPRSQPSTSGSQSESGSQSRDSSASRRVTRSQTRPRSEDNLDLD